MGGKGEALPGGGGGGMVKGQLSLRPVAAFFFIDHKCLRVTPWSSCYSQY